MNSNDFCSITGFAPRSSWISHCPVQKVQNQTGEVVGVSNDMMHPFVKLHHVQGPKLDFNAWSIKDGPKHVDQTACPMILTKPS